MSKEEVYKRDGGKCFYCGKELTLDESTHEHLLAKTHSGTNSNYNTTVACKSCNLEAGQLPVVSKVLLRETKLGKADRLPISPLKVTTLTIGEINIRIEE